MLIPLDGLDSEAALNQLYENLNVLLSHFPTDYIFKENKSLSEILEKLKENQCDGLDIVSINISDSKLILFYSDGGSEVLTLNRNTDNKIIEIIDENGEKINISYN